MTAIVAAGLAALPTMFSAYLLYRQNVKSNEREAHERAAVRADDLSREEQRLRTQERETAAERHRERYARFMRAMQTIMVGVEAASARGVVYGVTEADRAELATSYEDVVLDAPSEIANVISVLRSGLGDLLKAASEGGEQVRSESAGLGQLMDEARRLIRAELLGD